MTRGNLGSPISRWAASSLVQRGTMMPKAFGFDWVAPNADPALVSRA